MFLYILLLEDDKYYIGRTQNINSRPLDHFTNNGSYWTKKYTPIKILEVIPIDDYYDEDKYTIKYMSKYGIENVRGGSFCQIKLSKENIHTINQMIKGSEVVCPTDNPIPAGDKCYKCGNPGHFANQCKFKPTNLNKGSELMYYTNTQCEICNSNWHDTENHQQCCIIS